MATEYTAGITPDTTLEQFALRCARAFGALIEMRDESMDAPIPDEFAPGAFYQLRLDGTLARQASVAGMTKAEAKAEIEAFNQRQAAALADAEARDAALSQSYRRMISLVEQWEPPTKDHEGLKTFMLQQLQDSLKFDCGRTDRLAEYYAPFNGHASDWIQRQQEDADREVARAKEALDEELARAKSRTEWVKALRASLQLEPQSAT